MRTSSAFGDVVGGSRDSVSYRAGLLSSMADSKLVMLLGDATPAWRSGCTLLTELELTLLESLARIDEMDLRAVTSLPLAMLLTPLLGVSILATGLRLSEERNLEAREACLGSARVAYSELGR